MKFRIRNLQLLNAIVFLASVVYLIDLRNIALLLVSYFLFLVMGVNIGLHRGLSHKNLNPTTWLSRICLLFSAFTCLGRPSDWILVHQLHHMFSDQPQDPHSPKYCGRWRVLFNLWKVSASIPFKKIIRIKRAILKNPDIRWMDKNYYRVIGVYALALFFVGGWLGVVFGLCGPATFCLAATSLVNAGCHSQEGQVKNVSWISLLTFGEGYHKNHHEDPSRISEDEFLAFDISGKIFSWLRQK